MQDHSFEDQVTIHIESPDLTVAPGSSVTVPLVVHNLSGSDGFFELAVRGIPSTWVTVPSPVIRLAADEQREVPLIIQPPLPPRADLDGTSSSSERPARLLRNRPPRQLAP
jgi:hypothetical protein